MRSAEEINKTPVLLLTDEEVETLSDDRLPNGAQGMRSWAKKVRERAAKEAACPGHERVGTSTEEEARRGWHKGHCKHCGMSMTYDSGD